MAAASVLLGLVPTILGLAGSSTVGIGLVALQYPFLALLLGIASPAVNPLRTFWVRRSCKTDEPWRLFDTINYYPGVPKTAGVRYTVRIGTRSNIQYCNGHLFAFHLDVFRQQSICANHSDLDVSRYIHPYCGRRCIAHPCETVCKESSRNLDGARERILAELRSSQSPARFPARVVLVHLLILEHVNRYYSSYCPRYTWPLRPLVHSMYKTRRLW